MISKNIYLLSVPLLVILIVLGTQGNLMKFGKFALTTILPVTGLLIFIWGFVRQEWPGVDKSMESGILFAIFTALRLALLAGIFFAAVLALSSEELAHLFRAFGVRSRTLAVMVSCLNLWSDFRFHVGQVYVARCGRGLMPNRKFGTRLRQLPYTIRTLFISMLMHAIERANIWESTGLIERLESFSSCPSASQARSQVVGILLLILSIVWTTVATFCFFFL